MGDSLLSAAQKKAAETFSQHFHEKVTELESKRAKVSAELIQETVRSVIYV